MDSTELHRATVYRVLIRIRQELQLSVKMGHFLIRSIHTPAVLALAMEECNSAGSDEEIARRGRKLAAITRLETRIAAVPGIARGRLARAMPLNTKHNFREARLPSNPNRPRAHRLEWFPFAFPFLSKLIDIPPRAAAARPI